MDTLELGGNINLTGFSDLDPGRMIVIKKIVGNYARKFGDISSKFEQLSITMKSIHETESSNIFEVNAKIMNSGQPINAGINDRNIFVAIDSVLKKIEKQLSA